MGWCEGCQYQERVVSGFASHPIIFGPSVLSADFLNLGRQYVRFRKQAPITSTSTSWMASSSPISRSLPVLEATRRGTLLPIDVHLMVVDPERWIVPFSEAGANRLTFHIEATPHVHRVIEAIHARGCAAGVAINPGTPLVMLEEALPYVDHVLVMTVNPGFGGQSFITSMPRKISRLQQMLTVANSDPVIQVDGGIAPDTIRSVVEAGATSIVAGSALINDRGTIAGNLEALRSAIGR
jgi:ribulose-phosphate 3-epimerase